MGLFRVSGMLFFAYSAIALPLGFAFESVDAPVLPKIDCSEMMLAMDIKINTDKRYATLKDALSSDPNKRCQLNQKAGLDQEAALKAQEISKENNAQVCDSSLCFATYRRMKELLGNYKEKLLAGCKIASSAGSACTSSTLPSGESVRFKCISAKLREAAAAEKVSGRLITKAQEEAESFITLTKNLSDSYMKDEVEMHRFAHREELATSKMIDESGQLQSQGPTISILAQLKTAENPTITGKVLAKNGGASNLRDYYSKAGRLAQEQDIANKSASGFRDFAKEEAGLRANSERVLLSMAEENDRRAVLHSPPSERSPRLLGDSSGSSVLPGLNSAAALASQSAALASQSSQRSASSVPTPALSQSASEGYPSANGRASTAAATSALRKKAEDSRSTPKENAIVDKLQNDSSGKDIHAISPAGGNAKSTFVSGAGDLPVLDSGASGRSLASSKMGKVNGTGGVETSIGGKKKKDTTGAPACGSDKECMAAIGVDSPQFNRAGSLGLPSLGASDAGLGNLGALDSLFGPLPSSPAAISTLNNDHALGGGNWGSTNANEVHLVAGGLQAAPEVAPANSRSLFMRVKTAHENALKKGSVLLFHKKL